jgi:beta-N-acetylhexosaminidase
MCARGNDRVENGMTLGPVMVGVKGVELAPDEVELLRHPAVGGVILFTRNFESREQLANLTQAIAAVKTPRPLIAVDHEGGRVQRFREGFTRLPAARLFGQIYEVDKPRALRLAEHAGWLMAAELRSVSVDFSLAPVLDLDWGVSKVIGDRAFHRDPQIVAQLANRYMRGMKQAGMAATGKHFPGHGAVEADSHVAVAVDPRAYEDIAFSDLVPFQRLIRWGLAAVMPAHVLYSAVDERPAGFSRFWLQEVLRHRLGFQGVIFSDDLEMEGARVAGGVLERGHAALQAGCDMVLVCNDPTAMVRVVNGLQHQPDPASQLRLVRLHGRGGQPWAQLIASHAWQLASRALSNLESALV